MKRAFVPVKTSLLPIIPSPPLPDALWRQVTQNLSPVDQLSLSQTNSYFRDLVRDEAPEMEWGVRVEGQERFLARERQRVDEAVKGFLMAVAIHDYEDYKRYEYNGQDPSPKHEAEHLANGLILFGQSNGGLGNLPAILNALGFPRNSRTEQVLYSRVSWRILPQITTSIIEDLGGEDGLRRVQQEHLWQWDVFVSGISPLDPIGAMLYYLNSRDQALNTLPPYLIQWGEEILSNIGRITRHIGPSRAFPYVMLDPDVHRFTMDPVPLYPHPRGPSAFPE